MADAPAFDIRAYRRFEHDGYARMAQGYAAWADDVTAQVNGRILRAVGADTGVRLLDVACGPGTLSRAAAEAGCAVTGLDFAAPMLAIARERCPAGAFHEGDAEHLPFDDASFDAVVCSFGIMHFPHPERAIGEAYRVLQGGGRYVFTGWPAPERNPFMGLVLGAVQRYGDPDVELPEGPPLFRFGEPGECIATLEAAGFADVTVEAAPIVVRFAAAEDVVPKVRETTARLSALLDRQTDAARRSIEDAITEGARAYGGANGVAIPMPALLAVGRKP